MRRYFSFPQAPLNLTSTVPVLLVVTLKTLPPPASTFLLLPLLQNNLLRDTPSLSAFSTCFAKRPPLSFLLFPSLSPVQRHPRTRPTTTFKRTTATLRLPFAPQTASTCYYLLPTTSYRRCKRASRSDHARPSNVKLNLAQPQAPSSLSGQDRTSPSYNTQACFARQACASGPASPLLETDIDLSGPLLQSTTIRLAHDPGTRFRQRAIVVACFCPDAHACSEPSQTRDRPKLRQRHDLATF
ncbi:hypothetical protein V8C44DRAFT_81409 [Trichoderma aethiopicum]